MPGGAPDSLHVVCPHCHTTNRIKSADLSSQAPEKSVACGQCHQALFAGQPVELDAMQFERHIVRSDVPVLVDFWAPWCAPCRQMAPHFAEAARVLEPRFQLAKVDTEAHPGLAARWNIRNFPTLALFVRGREVARQAGAMGSAGIAQWARSQVT